MGSVAKTEVRISVAQEIGIRMDDLREGAQAEVHQAAGAQAALQEASKAVHRLNDHVAADLEGHLYGDDVASRVKLYIGRAVAALDTLAQRASNMQMTANGRVQALTVAVQSVKTFQDAEKIKMERDVEAEARELTSLKDRRLAEEASAPAVVPATAKKRSTVKRRA
jgi:hypothetical protein